MVVVWLSLSFRSCTRSLSLHVDRHCDIDCAKRIDEVVAMFSVFVDVAVVTVSILYITVARVVFVVCGVC